MTAQFPRENVYMVNVQLSARCDKELWLGGRALPKHSYPEGSFSVFNLELEPAAYLHSPFDTIQFYLPHAVLEEVANDCAAHRVGDLSCAPGISLLDPIVHHLGSCLLPALALPDQACSLFVDQVTLALITHLAHSYGGMRPPVPPASCRLAPWQLQRAMEKMTSRLGEDITLAEVARECRLSLSHFSRAFRRSTGLPPYKWLLQRRLDTAKDLMLRSALPLSEIALRCGFSDQSHLSRSFAQKVGTTPSAWRRAKMKG